MSKGFAGQRLRSGAARQRAKKNLLDRSNLPRFMIPRHEMMLLASDLRYVQGMQKAGASAQVVAEEMCKLMERYVCKHDCPESARLKLLLGQVAKSLAGLPEDDSRTDQPHTQRAKPEQRRVKVEKVSRPSYDYQVKKQALETLLP